MAHLTHDETDHCPLCIMVQDIFNEMSQTLEKASLNLNTEDIGFIFALLLTSVLEAAPTQDARNAFLQAVATHTTVLTEGNICMLAVPAPPEAVPNRGEMN